MTDNTLLELEALKIEAQKALTENRDAWKHCDAIADRIRALKTEPQDNEPQRYGPNICLACHGTGIATNSGPVGEFTEGDIQEAMRQVVEEAVREWPVSLEIGLNIIRKLREEKRGKT